MGKHVIGRVGEIAPGQRRIVDLEGRSIGVFNVKGTFYALRNACPHQSGPLCRGQVKGLLQATDQKHLELSREGEILRCPWHGWEFDVRTGQSWCDPKRLRLMNYAVSVESGVKLVEGPYVAETFPVSIEDDYVVVETK